MTSVILFVLGAIVGSFLNVIGLRWGSGQVFSGRSKCFSCGKTLHWYELIPILSFFWQKGRCRGCKSKISFQYPIIEILTGLVFLSIYNLPFTTLQTFIFLVVFSLYIIILIYDLKHKIIPDFLVYSAILLSVFGRLLSTGSILDWLAGPIIFTFFAFIWFISRGRAMGFGDAKLGLSIGLLLGAEQGFSATILAFWLGTGLTLIYMVLSQVFCLFRREKKLTMKSEIPFAPFMILGAWISLIYDFNILFLS